MIICINVRISESKNACLRRTLGLRVSPFLDTSAHLASRCLVKVVLPQQQVPMILLVEWIGLTVSLVVEFPVWHGMTKVALP